VELCFTYETVCLWRNSEMDSAGKHTDGNRLQQFTFPEEDRALFTTTPWKPGEYRWFRSSNVVPIEQWRDLKPPFGGNAA
jgi:hypothetical protein